MDIQSDNQYQEYINRYTPLSISGNNNQLYILASMMEFSVSGSGNTILMSESQIDLEISGNQNRIYIDNSKVRLIIKGNKNLISGQGNHKIQIYNNMGTLNTFDGNCTSPLPPQSSAQPQFPTQNIAQPNHPNQSNSLPTSTSSSPLSTTTTSSKVGLSGDEINRIGIRKYCGQDFDCSICWDTIANGMDVRYLFCEHCFHVTCTENWLKLSSTCPICQKDIKAKITN